MAGAHDGARATLIRGATIVTMDRQGDLQGDILVARRHDRRDRAVDRARRARRSSTRAGCIVIPGLVNAHMHTWQTALRGIAANWTLPEYFRKMHAGLATVFSRKTCTSRPTSAR